MSLYDKASLVLIPSGTKAGTVYSQKPTSGDGDFDFTRSTYATRVNSQGLIEKERSNLILQSNSFDTTWTTTSSTLTSGQSGYDGSSDAWLLEATSTSARVVQNNTTSGVQTFSCYAKAGTANYLAFYNIVSGSAPRAWFNLSNGTIENANHYIDANIESVGSGWYRCSLTYNATLSDVRIYVAVTAGTFSDTSSGDNIYIQDAQLEQGLVATDYIETTTSAVYTGITDNVPRLDYDGDCPSLLLEPSRTNLITKSEYITGQNVTVTQNDITSPEGVVNAAKFVEDTSLSAHNLHLASVIPTNASAVDYTLSIFAKKKEREHLQLSLYADGTSTNSQGFDLTNGTYSGGSEGKIEDYGNGWYRCSFTASVTNSTGGYNFARANMGQSLTSFYYTGNGTSGLYYYGFQLEQGSYATSYIPTYGTSVTRAAETNSVTGISDLIGQTEGTWFLDYVYLGLEAVNQNWFALQDTSGSDRILFYSSGNTSELRFLFAANGSTLIDNSSVIAETSGTRYKVAVSYKSGAISIYINGNEIASYNTAFTFGNEMSLFTFKQSNQQPAARVNQTLLLKTALTDQECIDLTT